MKPQPPAPGQLQTEALLQQGVQLHVQNRLADAERVYQDVLRRQPMHAGALHLLGLIALQSASPGRSVELFDRALAIRSDFAEAHGDRGTALYMIDRFEDAVLSYNRAIALKPGVAGHHANRGNALQALGRQDEALASYDRAIALQPAAAEAHFGRGVTLNLLKRYEDALASHDRAIALNPGYAKAFQGRGAALHGLERLDDAIASYERAIVLNPEFAEALVDLGVVLEAAGRHEEAIASHDRAIALKPGFAEAYDYRGLPLLSLGRAEEALASFETAISLRPQSAAAHTHRGNALQQLLRPEEALASHDHAIGLQPDYADAYSNRGVALADLGRFDEAVVSYETSIRLKPDFPKNHFNYALSLLQSGQFEAGWREYEWRLRLEDRVLEHRYDQPIWSGEQACEGKTVFLHHEQGYGDTLQFCRYAASVAARGADVILSAPASLHGLLATLEPKVTLIGAKDVPERFDFHRSLLSLPLAFGTDIPSAPRYLTADETLSAAWAAALGPRTRPRIGVAWSGNPVHRNDANRSIPFSLFQSIFGGGVDWMALQNKLRPADADLVAQSKARFFGHALGTFSDTAALIDQLDLVITVDTSVAHLAGALGKPVWILLPFNADWRWLRDREDSPWYPNGRLFRQQTRGDWSAVLEAVKAELPAFLQALG